MNSWLFAIHLFATTAMTGIIWFIQLVHYPLFQTVGSNHFVEYERAHTRLTGIVVMPLMLSELITGVLVCLYYAKTDLFYLGWTGLALIVFIWLVTFIYFVPIHRSLSRQFDQMTSVRLVHLNWIRTIAWSLRSGLVLFIAFNPNV